MPRRTLCAAAVLLIAALAIVGCGGSKSASSTGSKTATPGAVSSTTATKKGSGTSGAGTVTAGPTTSSASTSAPEAPKRKPPKHSKPTKADTQVRIAAAFIIAAHGRVSPPQISLPSNVRIELLLINHDAKPHSVVLSVAHFASVSVPARGRTTTDVTGAPKGTYTLSVDGAKKATIVVGVVPGP